MTGTPAEGTGRTPEVSLILPVYQGESFVAGSVERVLAALDAEGAPFELIVVDDGSRDHTWERLRELAAARGDERLRLLRLPRNGGKGLAVRRGMAAARGSFRLYTDADLAYPPANLGAVLGALRSGAEVVVASRCHPDSRFEREVGPLRVLLRRGLGWLFRALAYLAGLGRMEDSQAGLKGFSARAAQRIFPALSIDRYAFDVELLGVARRLGLAVTDVPVVFTYQAGRGLRRICVDGWVMLRDLVRIRWRGPAGAQPSRVGPTPGSATPLLGLVLLFLLFRLAILLLAFDDVFTPGYELWPVGTTASQILQGLPALPLFEFHDSHSGGQVLSALLTAASFAAWGANAFALKLVPVGFALLTLVVTFLGVRRLAGRGPALLAGLLLVFAPAAFVDFTSANYGNHGEVVCFVALMLAAFVPVLGEGGHRARPQLVFGLCCGLAVWYALSSLLVLAILLPLWWCARGLRLLGRTFAAWVGGLVLGLLPGLYLLLNYDAPQAHWLLAKFVERRQVGELGPPARLARFWADLLPDAACSYPLGPVPGEALDGAFVALWGLSLAVLALRWRRSLGRCARRLFIPWGTSRVAPRDLRVGLLAYPVLLALAYAASDFQVGDWEGVRWGGYRYFMTLFYVLALVQVALFVELRPVRPCLARWLAGVGVALGLAGNLGHNFDPQTFGDALRVSGVNDLKISRLFGQHRWADDTGRVADVLEGFSRPTRAEVYRGLGYHRAQIVLREDGRRHTDQFDPTAEVQRFPARYASFVARGVGTAVAEHQAYVGQTQAAKRGLSRLLGSPSPWAEAMVQGLLLTSEPVVPALRWERLTVASTLLASLPAHLIVAAHEGLGMWVGAALGRGLPRDVELAGRFLAEVVFVEYDAPRCSAFVRGLGRSSPGTVSAGQPLGQPLDTLLPAVALPWLHEGLGWRDAELTEESERAARMPVDPDAADAWKRGVARAAALAAHPVDRDPPGADDTVLPPSGTGPGR